MRDIGGGFEFSADKMSHHIWRLHLSIYYHHPLPANIYQKYRHRASIEIFRLYEIYERILTLKIASKTIAQSSKREIWVNSTIRFSQAHTPYLVGYIGIVCSFYYPIIINNKILLRPPFLLGIPDGNSVKML